MTADAILDLVAISTGFQSCNHMAVTFIHPVDFINPVKSVMACLDFTERVSHHGEKSSDAAPRSTADRQVAGRFVAFACFPSGLRREEKSVSPLGTMARMGRLE